MIILAALVLELPKFWFMGGITGPYHILPLFSGGPISESPKFWLVLHLFFALVTVLLLCAKVLGYTLGSRAYSLLKASFCITMLLIILNMKNLGGASKTVAMMINISAVLVLCFLAFLANNNKTDLGYFAYEYATGHQFPILFSLATVFSGFLCIPGIVF